MWFWWPVTVGEGHTFTLEHLERQEQFFKTFALTNHSRNPASYTMNVVARRTMRTLMRPAQAGTFAPMSTMPAVKPQPEFSSGTWVFR